jgi:hypothetical protein
MQDHDEVFDKLMEEDEKDRQKKQSKEKNVEGLEKIKPTFPPKKSKPLVKIASLRHGGSVSSASKRADGCATRGKTRGRMV